jgi:hypothetical protein
MQLLQLQQLLLIPRCRRYCCCYCLVVLVVGGQGRRMSQKCDRGGAVECEHEDSTNIREVVAVSVQRWRTTSTTNNRDNNDDDDDDDDDDDAIIVKTGS